MFAESYNYIRNCFRVVVIFVYILGLVRKVCEIDSLLSQLYLSL